MCVRETLIVGDEFMRTPVDYVMSFERVIGLRELDDGLELFNGSGGIVGA